MECKEYGTEECYGYDFECIKGSYLDKLNEAGGDYFENASQNFRTIIFRNEDALMGQESYMSTDSKGEVFLTSINYNVWFNDNGLLFFNNMIFKDGSGFGNIFFGHSVDGVPQYFKKYTYFELLDMQANAPDHELLKAMNKVLESFANKSSSGMVADSNDSQPQK